MEWTCFFVNQNVHPTKPLKSFQGYVKIGGLQHLGILGIVNPATRIEGFVPHCVMSANHPVGMF